jgi:hypothetical protein
MNAGLLLLLLVVVVGRGWSLPGWWDAAVLLPSPPGTAAAAVLGGPVFDSHLSGWNCKQCQTMTAATQALAVGAPLVQTCTGAITGCCATHMSSAMNEIYSVAKVPALAGVVHGVDTSHYLEACGQDATVATTTAAAVAHSSHSCITCATTLSMTQSSACHSHCACTPSRAHHTTS